MKQQAFSAYLPSYEYLPDGEPHVFGDRLYIVGSHDKFGGRRFCMNDYVSWSAPVNDLSDWRCDGVIYRKDQDPSNPDGKSALWAPDMAKGADGRYYLYYCLAADHPQVGVAVCDTPNGKFEFLAHVQDENGGVLGRRPQDTLPFDPSIFIDDDGKVWLYYGNGYMRPVKKSKHRKASACVELCADMITVKSGPYPLIPTTQNSQGTGFEKHEFFEACSLRKYGGRYYLTYSSAQTHELCYAISDRPNGGFQYGGVLISNGDIRPEDNVTIGFNARPNTHVKNYIGNNHGGLLHLNDRYYIFYHRQTNRHMFSRQGCAEPIKMLPDGHFEQAELTSCGLNGGPLVGTGTYEARIACHLYSAQGALYSAHPVVQNKKHPAFTQEDADREETPNQYIQNMRSGATAGFRYFTFDGAARISITTRGKGKGEMVVRDGEGGHIVARILVEPSHTWHCFSAPLTIADGIRSLYFTYEGKKAIDFMSFILE